MPDRGHHTTPAGSLNAARRRFCVTWLDKRDGKRHSRSYVHRKSAQTRVAKLAAWPAFFADIGLEDRGRTS